MGNNLTAGNTFLVCLIAGITSGMGNGSVFGAALMCTIGRAPFEDWGGWGSQVYDPSTFQGFVTWCMLVFGVAFALMVSVGMSRHGELEAVAARKGQ